MKIEKNRQIESIGAVLAMDLNAGAAMESPCIENAPYGHMEKSLWRTTDSAQNVRNLWMSWQRLCICVVFGAFQDPLHSCHCTIAEYCKDIQTTSKTKRLKTSELVSSSMFMTGRCRGLQVPAFSRFLASIIGTS